MAALGVAIACTLLYIITLYILRCLWSNHCIHSTLHTPAAERSWPRTTHAVASNTGNCGELPAGSWVYGFIAISAYT